MYILLSLVLASVSERDTVVSATATAAAEVIMGRVGRGKKWREREGKCASIYTGLIMKLCRGYCTGIGTSIENQ